MKTRLPLSLSENIGWRSEWMHASSLGSTLNIDRAPWSTGGSFSESLWIIPRSWLRTRTRLSFDDCVRQDADTSHKKLTPLKTLPKNCVITWSVPAIRSKTRFLRPTPVRHPQSLYLLLTRWLSVGKQRGTNPFLRRWASPRDSQP